MLHAVHCFRVILPALALVALLTSAVRTPRRRQSRPNRSPWRARRWF